MHDVWSEADLWAALQSKESRPGLVRDCVEDADLARRVADLAIAHLAAERVDDRALAVNLGRALLARRVARHAAERMLSTPADFYGHVDPIAPEAPVSLALTTVRLVAVGRTTSMTAASALLRAALEHAETRREAFLAVAEHDADAALEHLGPLLEAHPDLAGAVGTLFALEHITRCEDAARKVAPLSKTTREAFAEALHKHLDRVHAIKRWVGCRRILFGH